MDGWGAVDGSMRLRVVASIGPTMLAGVLQPRWGNLNLLIPGHVRVARLATGQLTICSATASFRPDSA
jgi:hypothetical protein